MLEWTPKCRQRISGKLFHIILNKPILGRYLHPLWIRHWDSASHNSRKHNSVVTVAPIRQSHFGPIHVRVPAWRHTVSDVRDGHVSVGLGGVRLWSAGVQAAPSIDERSPGTGRVVGLGELAAPTLRLILQRHVRRRRAIMMTDDQTAVVRRRCRLCPVCTTSSDTWRMFWLRVVTPARQQPISLTRTHSHIHRLLSICIYTLWATKNV